MKTLIVIRHAKAVAHDAVAKDFDRALAPRGHRDASEVSSRLATTCSSPDMMIVSTAVRTAETAVYFSDAWKLDESSIRREMCVYDAPLRTLIALVGELPAAVSTVALVGHNPGVSVLVDYLTDGQYGDMATCAVVVVDIPSAETWDEVAAGTGRVRSAYAP